MALLQDLWGRIETDFVVVGGENGRYEDWQRWYVNKVKGESAMMEGGGHGGCGGV